MDFHRSFSGRYAVFTSVFVWLYLSVVETHSHKDDDTIARVDIVEQIAVRQFPDRLFKRSFRSGSKDEYDYFEHFQLTFSADAQVKVFGATGEVRETRTIGRNAPDGGYSVFKGRVLKQENSEHVMKHGEKSPFHLPPSDPKADGTDSQHPEDLGWARFTFLGHANDGNSRLHKRSFHRSSPIIDGVMSINGELFRIQPVEKYRLHKRSLDAEPPFDFAAGGQQIVLYRESNVVKNSNSDSDPASFCGHDHSEYNMRKVREHLEKKDNRYMTQIPGPFDGDRPLADLEKRVGDGCPTARKILYMGVASDCLYTSNYEGEQNTLAQILSNWNQASKLFEDNFNVALGVVQIEIQTTCGNGLSWNQACSAGYDISSRLSDFSLWRSTQSEDAGLWHLMTACSSGTTVGVAWVDTLCQTNAVRTSEGQFVNGAGVSSLNANEWIVISHEIGHNFGAIHDCNGQLCSSDTSQCNPCASDCDCKAAYIMHPTSDVKNSDFSPSSISDICSKDSVRGRCLADPGSQVVIGEQQCGNGIKEPGEECDCGPADSSDCQNSQCCDGSTCKLKAGAQCADENDLCCSQCQVLASGTVCRPSRSVCDNEEICDGSSGDCPIDSYVEDLTTCQIDENTEGQCASGDCTSRDLQCELKGTLLGLDRECSGYGDQCQMFCTGDNVGYCVQVSGFFLDGTPCSYGGKCVNGSCDVRGVNAFVGWFQNNIALGIAIIVAVSITLCAFCYRFVMASAAQKDRTAASARARRQNQYPRDHFLGNGAPRTTQRAPRPQSLLTETQPRVPYPQHAQGNRYSMPAVPPKGRRQSRRTQDEWVDPAEFNGNVGDVDPEVLATIASMEEKAKRDLDREATKKKQPTPARKKKVLPSINQVYPEPSAPPLESGRRGRRQISIHSSSKGFNEQLDRELRILKRSSTPEMRELEKGGDLQVDTDVGTIPEGARSGSVSPSKTTAFRRQSRMKKHKAVLKGPNRHDDDDDEDVDIAPEPPAKDR